MGDAGCVECLNSALRHTVVFCIDDVEILACGNRGFYNLARFLKTPAVSTGSVCNQVDPSFVAGFQYCRAASDLCGGAELSADQDEVDNRELLVEYPVDCGVSFGCHVGDERCLVVRGVGLDQTVEEEYGDTGGFRRFQDVVPAGCVGCGNKEVVDAVADIALCCSDLFAVVGCVRLFCVVAVRPGEYVVHVFNVRLAVSGFFRGQVYNTDLDKLLARRSRGFLFAAGKCRCQHEYRCERQDCDLCDLFHLSSSTFIEFRAYALLPVMGPFCCGRYRHPYAVGTIFYGCVFQRAVSLQYFMKSLCYFTNELRGTCFWLRPPEGMVE